MLKLEQDSDDTTLLVNVVESKKKKETYDSKISVALVMVQRNPDAV